MKFCPKCGSKLLGDFCHECGCDTKALEGQEEIKDHVPYQNETKIRVGGMEKKYKKLKMCLPHIFLLIFSLASFLIYLAPVTSILMIRFNLYEMLQGELSFVVIILIVLSVTDVIFSFSVIMRVCASEIEIPQFINFMCVLSTAMYLLGSIAMMIYFSANSIPIGACFILLVVFSALVIVLQLFFIILNNARGLGTKSINNKPEKSYVKRRYSKIGIREVIAVLIFIAAFAILIFCCIKML